jgi:hypothetical protein
VVSDRDLIGQFLELAFQMVFAGVVRIRHGGSEESIDAVRRQSSKWVTDRSQSQLTYLIEVRGTALRELKWFSVKSASRRHKGWRSTERCDAEAKQRTNPKTEETQKERKEFEDAWLLYVLGVAVRKDDPNTPLVLLAKLRHLASPRLATWRSPGGDQKFLERGGETWRFAPTIQMIFGLSNVFGSHFSV